jgi:hypothetical protein
MHYVALYQPFSLAQTSHKEYIMWNIHNIRSREVENLKIEIDYQSGNTDTDLGNQ